MRFFVVHENASDTIISSTHVPASKRMTVTVMHIFQYRRQKVISGSGMVSLTIGLRKIKERDMAFVELLKNVSAWLLFTTAMHYV